MLSSHTLRLATHNAVLTSFSQQLFLDQALLTTHTLQLAAHDLLLTSHTSLLTTHSLLLAQKMDAANVYTKAEVDASLAAQDTQIAAKANASDMNSALALKADTTAVNAGLALKADAANVYTRTEVDASQLAQNNAIAQKADTSAVNTALAAKANTTDMNTALALKADTASVYTKTEMDASLAGKSPTDHSHNLQGLGGAVTDAQVPNTITIDRATSATFAAAADRATTATFALAVAQATTSTYASTATTATMALGLAGFNPASKADAASVYSKAEVDALQAAQDTVITGKADAGNVYDKAAVDSALALKANLADVATSLIAKADAANVYTKAESDGLYLQTESDTLQTVTRRQAETDQNLTLTGDVQTLTHTGATRLEIASQNGYVGVEDLMIGNNKIGVSGNAAVTSMSANKLAISTAATVAGNLGVGTASPVAALDVLGQAGSAADLCPLGSKSASATNEGSVAGAFDGDTSSYWGVLNYAAPQWLMVDFGSTPQMITGYRMLRMHNWDIPRWTFQGSNDGSSWIDLDVRTSEPYDNNLNTYTFNNRTAYRYYRVYFSVRPGFSWVVIGELQMFSQYSTHLLVASPSMVSPPLGSIVTTPAAVSRLIEYTRPAQLAAAGRSTVMGAVAISEKSETPSAILFDALRNGSPSEPPR
jgi:hypothetical protein